MRTKYFGIRLSEDEHSVLKETSQELGLSMSELFRLLTYSCHNQLEAVKRRIKAVEKDVSWEGKPPFPILSIEDISGDEAYHRKRARPAKRYILSIIKKMEPNGDGKLFLFKEEKVARRFAAIARSCSSRSSHRASRSTLEYPLKVSAHIDRNYDSGLWGVSVWVRNEEAYNASSGD